MKKRIWMAIAATAVLLLSSCSAIQDLINPKPPAAPTGLTASQGTFTDKIALSWDAVSKVDSYNTYMASSSIGTYTKIGSTTSTSADVTAGITAGTHYWFKVEAVGSNGKTSAPSDAAEGYSKTSTTTTTIGTPANLTASQGTYTDKIVLSWTAVSGAANYKVYEATSAAGTYLPYSTLVTTAGAEITTTSADLGVHYFYKVSALTSAGSESAKSAYAEGWAGTSTSTGPGTPGGLTASQGDYPDKIVLSWMAVTGASSYKVYEAASATGTYVAFSGTVTTAGAEITIASGNIGTHFFYKVSALNSAGTEGLKSSYAEGWAGLSTPTGLTVGSATSSSLVISWTSVTGASTYSLHRATSSGGTYSPVTTVSSTSYTDTGLSSNTTYYYKVQANSSSGVSSALSGYDSGTTLAGTTIPIAPQGMTASQGTYTDRIVLDWNTVTGASKYYVYEANSAYGTYSQLSGYVTTPGAEITGTGVSAGTHYFYKASAVNSAGVEGPQSGYAEGWAGLSAPTGLTVGSATASSLTVSWTFVTGASTYSLHRAASSGGTYSLVTTTSSTSYTNTGLSSNTTYYYKVQANSSSGVSSALSGYAYGTTLSSTVSIHWGTAITGYYQFKTNDTADSDMRFWKTGTTNMATTSSCIVQVNKVSGSSFGGFGMVFNYDDDNNFDIFEIAVDGTYRVLEKYNGIWQTPLVDWKSSSAILGMNSTNTLKSVYTYGYLAAAGGNAYKHQLSINGTNIEYVWNTSPMTGKTGFVVDTDYESFPGTTLDIRFKQTSPTTMPNGVEGGGGLNMIPGDDAAAFEPVPASGGQKPGSAAEQPAPVGIRSRL